MEVLERLEVPYAVLRRSECVVMRDFGSADFRTAVARRLLETCGDRCQNASNATSDSPGATLRVMRLECDDDPQTVLLAGVPRAPRATTGDSLCRTPLTHRERVVAEYLASGTSVRDVARTLAISYHTVRRHTESIYRKTGVRNRVQLAAMIASRHADGGA